MSSLSSMAPILLLAMSIFSIISPSSASRQLLHHHADIKTTFQVTLKQVDSGGEFTKFELLQRTTKRSRKRMEKLCAKVSGESIDVPVHAGNGEYLMELMIGTPRLPYSAAIDTGSDLIWTQCKQCNKCFHQSTPLYNPDNSSSFSILPCSSAFCSALPRSWCNQGECAYLYGYGDGSYTGGVMGLETFTFAKVSVPKIAFGCGLQNVGSYLGGGIVGLGRGPLSLVSQLDEPRFSYCLTSIYSTKSSQLLMGSLASLKGIATPGSILTTPLIKNPSFPAFYYLSLKGITIGETLLPINQSSFAIKADGSGGMIIDSGTSITYLEPSAFELVKKEFAQQMQLTVNENNDTGLELCFTLPWSNAQIIQVPGMTFHFAGADLDLAVENYFAEVENGVACLMMGSTSGLSVFGNFQQQNLLVAYDLVAETLSFVQTPCDHM